MDSLTITSALLSNSPLKEMEVAFFSMINGSWPLDEYKGSGMFLLECHK